MAYQAMVTGDRLARDRQSDHQIPLTGQPMQQRRDRSHQQHDHRGALLAGYTLQ